MWILATSGTRGTAPDSGNLLPYNWANNINNTRFVSASVDKATEPGTLALLGLGLLTLARYTRR